VDKIHPDKSANNERLEHWRTHTMVEIKKTILSGEDSHHWLNFEFFAHPALNRADWKSAVDKVFQRGLDQCRADGVQYWMGCTLKELDRYQDQGFTLKADLYSGHELAGGWVKWEQAKDSHLA
jgi:Leu/Phe-tRNA-protein transferase